MPTVVKVKVYHPVRWKMAFGYPDRTGMFHCTGSHNHHLRILGWCCDPEPPHRDWKVPTGWSWTVRSPQQPGAVIDDLVQDRSTINTVKRGKILHTWLESTYRYRYWLARRWWGRHSGEEGEMINPTSHNLCDVRAWGSCISGSKWRLVATESCGRPACLGFACTPLSSQFHEPMVWPNIAAFDKVADWMDVWVHCLKVHH